MSPQNIYAFLTKATISLAFLLMATDITRAQYQYQLPNFGNYQQYLAANADHHTSGSILQPSPWGGGATRSDGRTSQYANYNSYNNQGRILASAS